MNCFFCKGDLEDNTSTYMIDLGKCIVIIKNVPSKICTQCGEVSYSDEVARQLEKIVRSARSSQSEFSVINYELMQVA